MTEVSTNLRNIFFHKIPPILKLEVGFFSDKKSFSKIDQICENLFGRGRVFKKKQFTVFRHKNSKTFLTSSFKIGGICSQKSFSEFLFFFFRNKLQVKKIWRILENLQKTFFIGQKSNFKFQNRGYFVKKNIPQIC